MKLVSWNVNSVGARKDRLIAWLGKHAPDVICLQELKGVDDAFPRAEVQALGYHVETFGQRTYNGVAILSKSPMTDVRRNFGDGDEDVEARMISARIEGLTVMSCYIPNGKELSSDKFAYKMRWLTRLKAYLNAHHTPSDPLCVCGDYNIAPEDRDVHAPDEWKDGVLFHDSVRAEFQSLLGWGLFDSFRLKNDEAGKFSWWDYRMLGFPKGRGLRIDHILVTAPLKDRVTSVAIDRDERKGKLPSDHAPVITELGWP